MNLDILTKPWFIQLIGLPASGKSTLVSKLLKGPLCQSSVKVLSTDDYIESMAEKENTTYNVVFKDYIDEATKMLEVNFTNAIWWKDTIIHDQTNLTKKKRAKFLSRVPDTYLKICIDVHCTDFGVWQERLNNRPGKVIPDNVIETMTKSYEKPETSEGFGYVIYHHSSCEIDELRNID